jgi:flagellar protein FliO/FliZ
MAILDFLRAVLALSVTLGLIGLAAWALRRYAPDLIARLQGGPRRERRLQIVETLVLDPSRRLLLVRVGGEERLILLGEGRELNPPKPSDR